MTQPAPRSPGEWGTDPSPSDVLTFALDQSGEESVPSSDFGRERYVRNPYLRSHYGARRLTTIRLAVTVREAATSARNAVAKLPSMPWPVQCAGHRGAARDANRRNPRSVRLTSVRPLSRKAASHLRP
jgi:hypothetical protein